MGQSESRGWIIGRPARKEYIAPGDFLESRPERARVYIDKARAERHAESMNQHEAGIPLRSRETWTVLDAPKVSEPVDIVI